MGCVDRGLWDWVAGILRQRRSGWLSLVAAVVVTLVGARAAHGAPTAVMVLYFDNDTGSAEYDNLAKGLADMMITDLTAVPSLRIVEREKLEALLKELKLQRRKYFDPKTAQRIGKGTGAAYAVTGSFLSIEPNIRLDVRMIKIDSGVVVKSASVTGTKDKFFDLQQQLTGKLIEALSGVLAVGDAAKAAAAARSNRVDDLGVVLAYSKGLDASDRGDLDGASKQLQKVVAASPEFQLGKDRYRQIMKALYDAKNVRTAQLSDSERTLLDHIQTELAKGNAGTSERNQAYRILLGQYHLTKVVQAIAKGSPPSTYREHLRAHVDSDLELFEETKALKRYKTGNSVHAFSEDDEKLAKEIGVDDPGSVFVFSNQPFQILQKLGNLLVNNSLSVAKLPMEGGRDVPCLFRLDPSYATSVPLFYQKALDHIDKYGEPYRERDSMRVLQDLGRALTIFGRPEEAIAKLQGGLERFPKSDEFSDVETEIRDILGGDVKARCK